MADFFAGFFFGGAADPSPSDSFDAFVPAVVADRAPRADAAEVRLKFRDGNAPAANTTIAVIVGCAGRR